MALPSELVGIIFLKLTLTYGKRFAEQYNGQSAEMIKGHWAHELEGVPEHAVRYGLENLPADHPPNVLQFRAICKQAREPMRSMLPAPRGPMSARVKQRLQEAIQRLNAGPIDVLAGARKLREKERSGILLTRAQKEFWRTALHHEQEREARERAENEDVQ